MIVDYLIRRAKRTPYAHLPAYMNRWWLVPYKRHDGPQEGVGPVAFRERPFSWLLQRFDVAVRVHEVLSSDKDRAYHDHPWDYITVILRGGYFEHTPGKWRRWYGPGSVLRRKAEHWHRLQLPVQFSVDGPLRLQPCTTLFITFRERQPWGFLVGGRKVPWRQYFGENT